MFWPWFATYAPSSASPVATAVATSAWAVSVPLNGGCGDGGRLCYAAWSCPTAVCSGCKVGDAQMHADVGEGENVA